MQGQKKQKKPDYKQMTLESPGLELQGSINNCYGDKYESADSASGYSCCLNVCGMLYAGFCCPCAACGCGPLVEIPQGHIGMKIVLGKVVGKYGPGLHTYNRCTEKIISVDMRVQSLNVNKQTLLTKDFVTVYIDVFVNYRIVVPEYALFKTSNYYGLLDLMVQAVMKNIVAERTLSQLLINRKEIEKSTCFFLDERSHPYGIDITSIETQSIALPHKMERVMATVAESEKRSEAKVIDAKGNLESAKIFRQAADELVKNPNSFELQYFETLKAIAMENPSTLIVPDSIMSTINRKLGKS
jgi:erythrocyte band 7 integral membrane protein